MAKSYWLINSNRSEVKRFMKNDKSIDGVFEYMFIDTGKIVGGLGNKPPVMTNTVSVEIDLAREIYERLLSKGWRKIEKIGILLSILLKKNSAISTEEYETTENTQSLSKIA